MLRLATATIVGLMIAAPAAVAQQQQGEVPGSTGCGVGTILFNGQRGVAPQVLAVTTNGTFGNQTFGITSGTLGCTRDGVIRPPTEVRMLVVSNLDNLARDVARGEGETLESLAQLIEIDPADQARFFGTLQANFGQIFPNENANADDVIAQIQATMAEDAVLSRYLG